MDRKAVEEWRRQIEREMAEETRRAFSWLYDAGFAEEEVQAGNGRFHLILNSGWGSVWIDVDGGGRSIELRAAPRGHWKHSAHPLPTLMAGQGLTPVSNRWGFEEPDGLRTALNRVSTALRELGVDNEDRLIEVDEAARNLSASEQWGANAVPPKKRGW